MKAEGMEEDLKVAVGPAVKNSGGAEVLEAVKLEEVRGTESSEAKGPR